MICKHCGREIAGNSSICPYCKIPIIRIKPKKICAYCKTEIKKGDKLCPGCGRNVPEKVRELLEKDETESTFRISEKEIFGDRDASFFEQEEVNLEKGNVDFILLMLSLLPPIFSIFSKVLFAEKGFLPWFITIIIVYFATSILISYFLDREIKRLWAKETGKKLGELMRLFFYLFPPYTLFFLLRKRKYKANPLLFFMAMHFALVTICFYI